MIEVTRVKTLTVKIYIKVLKHNIPLLLKNKVSPQNIFAFIYICDRTLSFGNFTFTTDYLLTTYEKMMIPPLTAFMSESAIKKAITKFHNLGFIFGERLSKNKRRWVINFPEMIKILDIVYSKIFPNYNFNHDYEIKSILELFVNNGWKCPAIHLEDAMQAKEALLAGKLKALEAKKKKINKISKKKKLSVNDVLFLMKDICKKEGLKFFQPTLTAKEKRCVKNFINYCAEEEIDVVKKIEKICLFWNEFSSGVLKTDTGKELILSPVIDFMEYFKHRKIIDKYIAFKDIDENEDIDENFDDTWEIKSIQL